MSYNNELYHYGVKGMRWGVRRARKAQAKYSAKASQQVKQLRKNQSALKKVLDSGIDDITELKLDKETKNAYNHEMRRSIDDAKKWVETKKDIMSMDITKVSAKDIKNRYEDTYRKYGAVYYPFL